MVLYFKGFIIDDTLHVFDAVYIFIKAVTDFDVTSSKLDTKETLT